jgi:hypothetical protein
LTNDLQVVCVILGGYLQLAACVCSLELLLEFSLDMNVTFSGLISLELDARHKCYLFLQLTIYFVIAQGINRVLARANAQTTEV